MKIIKSFSATDRKLRNLIVKIRSDSRLQKATELERLTELGLGLVDETGNCPLCGTNWNPGDLKKNLEEQLSDLKETAEMLKKIEELSYVLNEPIKGIISSITPILNNLETLEIKDKYEELELWLTSLKELSNSLEDALETYPDPKFSKEKVQRLLAPDNIFSILDEIYSSAKSRTPEPTPEQTAWETLIRLEENLKVYEKSKIELENASLAYKKAEILIKCYGESMESVLGNLYNGIKDRFEELYVGMHGDDEGKFKAEIHPVKSGLDFKVDFHGKGIHPPHALHSEGHQDTMGICLYLALAENITDGFIDLVILDDVMMSVDNVHQRKICRLLAKSFKGRQFFITTHDKTWARQLRSEVCEL